MTSRLLFAAGSLLALWFPASAANEKLERETLRGIKQTFVVIEPIDIHTAALGISPTRLQSLAEVKVKLSGLKIIPPRDRTSESFVYIRVTSVGEAVVGFAVEIRFNQNATLQRDSAILAAGATTWSTTTVGVARRNQSADQISAVVEKSLDEFLGAVLSANPK